MKNTCISESLIADYDCKKDCYFLRFLDKIVNILHVPFVNQRPIGHVAHLSNAETLRL